MLYNVDITVYNRAYDTVNKTEVYYRSVVSSVEWENRKGANIIASGGYLDSDQATIYIPITKSGYLAPRAWEALATKTGYWTLRPEDIIVKSAVTDSISSAFTITQLRKKYDDVLTITSVDTMDFGSISMQHFAVGAK